MSLSAFYSATALRAPDFLSVCGKGQSISTASDHSQQDTIDAQVCIKADSTNLFPYTTQLV